MFFFTFFCGAFFHGGFMCRDLFFLLLWPTCTKCKIPHTGTGERLACCCCHPINSSHLGWLALAKKGKWALLAGAHSKVNDPMSFFRSFCLLAQSAKAAAFSSALALREASLSASSSTHKPKASWRERGRKTTQFLCSMKSSQQSIQYLKITSVFSLAWLPRTLGVGDNYPVVFRQKI